MPRSLADATSDARSSGQYGSANDTCVVTGPSKNVYARDLVKSIAWFDTTNVFGAISRRSDPAALGPNSRATPSSFIAHTLARYGTRCGGESGAFPRRGREAPRRPPTLSVGVGGPGGPS